ncbi:MAG TPA: hypothetical protein VFK02_11255 [Kofleriaceae bacterium]|nr:hypothetical protein [Kofleriaceae bacterium]
MSIAALVACSAAGAEPGPAGDAGPLPPSWKPLPAISAAVRAAVAAGGVAIDVVDAWGAPASGCYAVRVALHGGGRDAPALADEVLGGFAAAGATGPGAIAIREVAKPTTADGVLAFTFDRPPYHGRLRAHLGAGRVQALACFENQREPAVCEATCTRVLQGVQ